MSGARAGALPPLTTRMKSRPLGSSRAGISGVRCRSGLALGFSTGSFARMVHELGQRPDVVRDASLHRRRDPERDEQIQCYRRCVNNPNPPNGYEKGEPRHRQYCQTKCLKEFMDKMRKAGLVKEFSALDAAEEWIKNHTKEIIVGTVVVVGVVVYVVVTGGSGALSLALLSAG